jgi:hypothetical protein
MYEWERRKLTHQSGESFEGAGDPGFGVDLDQNVLSRVDVDLKKSSFVQGTVKQVEETLQSTDQ